MTLIDLFTSETGLRKMGQTAAPSPTVHFTVRELLEQAKADLWAKEVQTGYTSTYSWMANQLGHFALGFLGTSVIDWAYDAAKHQFTRLQLGNLPDWGWASLDVMLGLYMAWKEVSDYRAAKYDWVAAGATFPFDTEDVIKDAVSATIFMWLGVIVGIFSSWESETNPGWPLVGLAATLLIFLPTARYWLSRKKCFQQAGIPYLFRLSNFRAPSKEFPTCEILDFTRLQGHWRHMLVTGPPASGKTTLLAAIGAEYAFTMNKVRYTTFTELLEDSYTAIAQKERLARGKQVTPTWFRWRWQEAAIVLVDAVDSGAVTPAEVTPEDTARAFKALAELGHLRARQTVWAVGLSPDGQGAAEWIDLLSGFLDVDVASIGHVDLTPRNQEPGE